MSQSISTYASKDPIFILSTGRRSGTNFLFQLLLLHSSCRAGNIVREDFFLTHANILQRYTDSVYRSWDKDWKGQFNSPNPLLPYIGAGLLSFLDDESLKAVEDTALTTRLVTKTPDATNLSLFPQLFPNAKLLIMVRDGRAVVESDVKSFKRSYEEVMHEWADAARTIQQFLSTDSARQALIVKYEDLYQDTEQEVAKILSFLELDASLYDYKAMRELPVFGSSQIVTEAKQQLNWEGDKFAKFEPTKRWSHWDRSLHERFNWIAGHEAKQFGYSLKVCETASGMSTTSNTVRDWSWEIEKYLIPKRKALKRRWARAKKSMSNFS